MSKFGASQSRCRAVLGRTLTTSAVDEKIDLPKSELYIDRHTALQHHTARAAPSQVTSVARLSEIYDQMVSAAETH